jgi:cyclophilin family peptidyl-prolyl cis-trans isomerase
MSLSFKAIWLVIAGGLVAGFVGCRTMPSPVVGPVPPAVRTEFALAPHYQKMLRVGSFPIVGSTNVSDSALSEAAWIVSHLLAARPELLATLATNRARLAVMAYNEFTTDVPEHAGLKPRVFWDRRARGLGATPSAPAVSCGEENLLSFPGDIYPQENILVHEFAHAVHEMGLRTVDPTFDTRLLAAYRGATNRGLWKGTYAAVSHSEYWAESVQSWFDDNRENDSLHNHVNTRAELKAYDPAVAQLCAEAFGDGPWRYVRPAKRPAAERTHLLGYDPAQAPTFRWRDEPVPARPRVRLYTAAGELELELDTRAAPQTVTNFLRYVHAGHYADGQFYRAVTAQNQPTNAVKIAVLQARANQAKTNQFFPAIPLERTRDSGLRHLDGTLSMARSGPDTAQDQFFICIGDQPELDFGGRRHSDGQGFAAFGRVVQGLELIRQFHGQAVEGQQLREPVPVQRAIRLN